VRIAKEISPLVALFANKRTPPPYQTHLEQYNKDLGETARPTKFLAKLLEKVGQHAHMHEIPSTEEEGKEEGLIARMAGSKA
jgi:hypothetical protein